MKKLETLCVHPVEETEISGASATTLIAPSTAYRYLNDECLQYPGFYSTFNQTRLGSIITSLEKGVWGTAFSSGMAAITTAILAFASQHDHVIFSRDLYGGTWKLAEEELPKRRISVSYADNTLESFKNAIRENTKVIYLETPSNPLLSLVPLASIAKLARQHYIITIVDNTFATPVNQLPLTLGIDISVHSGTKYLSGHNDLPFGALAVNDEAYKAPILQTAQLYGGSLPPYECYMAERSIKTLALRVKRQNDSALKIARWLEQHPGIDRVYYPGLRSHADHKIARKQMKGFGGILSFELKATEQQLTDFQNRLRLVTPALSLGGVESLICSPILTSHRNLSPSQRQVLGINDNLLRLSVGIEDAGDIINDLEQAIASLH